MSIIRDSLRWLRTLITRRRDQGRDRLTFAPALLQTELPFWLMVPDCRVAVPFAERDFNIRIKNEYSELYFVEVTHSRRFCVWAGPTELLSEKVESLMKENDSPLLPRRCKTVVQIESICPIEVHAAADEDRQASQMLAALCTAHMEVLNRLIQRYRIATYDYFPFEVSPWDVPVWFVDVGGSSARVVLGDYHTWDEKPAIFSRGGTESQYELIGSDELDSALQLEPSPGELELLDALNLMERGDYSGAVRRITTALEVVVEAALRGELSKRYPPADVEQRLYASQNDFPGRCRQYYKLSGRGSENSVERTLKMVRDLRHEIVHRGLRISYADRGRAQMCVDQGRWTYNWFEDDPTRKDVREKRIALRSLGRHMPIVQAEITKEGIRFL